MIVSHDRSAPATLPAGGSIVSIGVFDGVHLGHQEILRRNVELSQRLGARSTVVTFRQHPKSLLLGRAPRTLTSLGHRLELFRRAGIEHTVVLTFDEELRQVPAASFAREFLVGTLRARSFVLGFDSKFGRDREGTPEFLRRQGFEVEVVPQVLVAGRAVSSTAIREAVELGDLTGAARMLGRPVAVYGEVVHGDALGAKLGFPTANLDLHHELRPPNGVYAARVRRVRYPAGEARDGGAAQVGQARGEEARDAVANIGFRPTVTGERPELPRVEAHVLDFTGDLYGAFLELEFVAFLRDEQRFPNLEALKLQIAADIERTRAVLAEPR